MNAVAMQGSIGSECLLEVEREGIRFRNVAARRVRVEIAVRNRAAEESARASLRLEAATFGAFLPWRPVATLSVPSIPAFGSALVTTELEQSPPPTAVQREP